MCEMHSLLGNVTAERECVCVWEGVRGHNPLCDVKIERGQWYMWCIIHDMVSKVRGLSWMWCVVKCQQ